LIVNISDTFAVKSSSLTFIQENSTAQTGTLLLSSLNRPLSSIQLLNITHFSFIFISNVITVFEINNGLRWI
jgi:hypothetical protein